MDHDQEAPEDACTEWMLGIKMCPGDILAQCEKFYDEQEASLEDEISALEEDIKEKEDATEIAEGKTEKWETATSKALAKAYRAEANIEMLLQKMVDTQRGVDPKMSQLQSFIDMLESKVNNTVNTADAVVAFADVRLPEIELLETRIQHDGPWVRSLIYRIAVDIGRWKASIEGKVILDFEVEAALARMKSVTEALRDQATSLKLALDNEAVALTDALEKQNEAHADREKAREYRVKVGTFLRELKTHYGNYRTEYKSDIAILKDKVSMYLAFVREFRNRFGQDLLFEMSKDHSQ